jgi:hypothetical protein
MQKIRDAPLSAEEQHLLYTLLTWCDASLTCWPRQSTIAAAMGRSDRQFRRLLGPLVARGIVIARREKSGAGLRYRIEIDALGVHVAESDRRSLGASSPDCQADEIVRTWHRERWGDAGHSPATNERAAARKMLDDGHALAEVLAAIPRAARRMREELRLSGWRLFQHAATYVAETLERRARESAAAVEIRRHRSADVAYQQRRSDARDRLAMLDAAALDRLEREHLTDDVRRHFGPESRSNFLVDALASPTNSGPESPTNSDAPGGET